MNNPEPKNPSEASSEALVGMVVVFRAFGICKDEARVAMIELMRRKEAGDEFDFEAMIKQKLAELPKSMLDPEIINVMNSIASFGGFSK
jgi:hypothetical protein